MQFVQFLCTASQAQGKDQSHHHCTQNVGQCEISRAHAKGSSFVATGDSVRMNGLEPLVLPLLCTVGRESGPQGNQTLLQTGVVPQPRGHNWQPSSTTRPHQTPLDLNRPHQVRSGPTRYYQAPPVTIMSHQAPSGTIRSHQVLPGPTRYYHVPSG